MSREKRASCAASEALAGSWDSSTAVPLPPAGDVPGAEQQGDDTAAQRPTIADRHNTPATATHAEPEGRTNLLLT